MFSKEFVDAFHLSFLGSLIASGGHRASIPTGLRLDTKGAKDEDEPDHARTRADTATRQPAKEEETKGGATAAATLRRRNARR